MRSSSTFLPQLVWVSVSRPEFYRTGLAAVQGWWPDLQYQGAASDCPWVRVREKWVARGHRKCTQRLYGQKPPVRFPDALPCLPVASSTTISSFPMQMLQDTRTPQALTSKFCPHWIHSSLESSKFFHSSPWLTKLSIWKRAMLGKCDCQCGKDSKQRTPW